MSDAEPRTVEQMAIDLDVSIPEILEAAKCFTTQPGTLLEGPVPQKIASRIEAYITTEK